MICPNCKAQFPDGIVFCNNCGSKLEAEIPVQQNAYQQQQYQQQSPVYQQPAPAYQQPAAPAQNELTRPMRTGEFFLTTFLIGLPLVGFILCLVWAFGSSANENKRNFCRAQLIWVLIALVISILFGVIAAAVGASIIDEIGYMF